MAFCDWLLSINMSFEVHSQKCFNHFYSPILFHYMDISPFVYLIHQLMDIRAVFTGYKGSEQIS